MFAMEWWDEIRGARSRVTNREGDGNNHRNRSAEEETQRREKQQKLKDKQGERWEVLNRSKTCIDENEVDQSIWDLSVNQRQHDPCTTISSCLLFLINQSINQVPVCLQPLLHSTASLPVKKGNVLLCFTSSTSFLSGWVYVGGRFCFGNWSLCLQMTNSRSFSY